MTQEEILEYNKKCAEFLEMEFEIHSNTWRYKDWITTQLLFHLDWNWIMEVVEAIEKLGYQLDITGNEIGISSNIMSMRNIPTGGTMNSYNEKYYPTIISVTEEEYSKKEAVVQAINQFLIWRNEQ
jgi:hypothetical protein